jgi:hypothetical protein
MDRIAFGWWGLAALAVAHASGPAAAAAETPVDLELVLAVDVSGSMDPDEHAIQRRGYVEAFTHPEVVGAVRSGPFGRIAVAYVEWGGPASQAVTVPWTLVEDLDTAADFAAGLGEASLGRFRGTSISGALTFSAPLFEGNGYDGLRRVVDVSGDGPNNAGAPVVPARDAVVGAGVVVNGLPIALKVPGFSGIGGSDLVAYYRECVIGGPGAFVIPVTEAGQLAEAIRQKLVLEIAGLPARPVPAAQRHPIQAAKPIDCLIGERLRRVWERDP